MSSNFVSKEDISAQFNGVNTIITLSNGAFQIDDIFIGGAVYTDFSHTSGSDTITLDDAFASGISGYVDYYKSAPSGVSGFLTVSAIKNEFKARKDNTFPDISDDLFLYWINAINRFLYPKLYDNDPNVYIDDDTLITTSDGVGEYTIPTDIETLRILGTGLFEIDDNGTEKDKTLITTRPNSTVKGWDIFNNKLIITPTPNSVKTYRFKYIPLIGTLIDDGSSTIIPEIYADMFFNALDRYFEQFDENEFRESIADQRFLRDLDNMISSIRITPKNFLY